MGTSFRVDLGSPACPYLLIASNGRCNVFIRICCLPFELVGFCNLDSALEFLNVHPVRRCSFRHSQSTANCGRFLGRTLCSCAAWEVKPRSGRHRDGEMTFTGLKLDDLVCNVCRKRGCVTWSFTEGSRCYYHSGYTPKMITPSASSPLKTESASASPSIPPENG